MFSLLSKKKKGMDVTDENLVTLAKYLESTLEPDPTTRKNAENYLQSVEGNQGYSQLLLGLIIKEGVPPNITHAAAVTFKNFVKRNWKILEDSPNQISESDRLFIKANIVELMLRSPELVQKQLSEAVSLIGREDFPDNWKELLPAMVEKFGSGDFAIINGVLQTAHSLFKRYRHEHKSEALWREIKYVLDVFADPLTKLFEGCVSFIQGNVGNEPNLKMGMSVAVMVAKIFESLNAQDLPEYFEDHIKEWMESFMVLFAIEAPCLQSNDPNEAGLIDQYRAQVCEIAAMYAQKYDEEFNDYLPGFVETIWQLLTNVGHQPKYDLLVCAAIQFLVVVSERPQYAPIFAADGALKTICESVILPNMEFRDVDKELFEDNPEEYIRKDIEGSDSHTRRRAASDFVRALSKHFETQVFEIFGSHIEELLRQYGSDPVNAWPKKDAAVYLVTSLASRGSTAKLGVTQTSQLVPIEQFYVAHIQPELVDAKLDERPVLKAGALRFLVTFRNHVDKAHLIQALPMCVKFIKASSQVVHSYAAHTIERILMVHDSQNSNLTKIRPEDFASLTQPLLGNIFATLSTDESGENEYLMKCLMRSLSLLQEASVPYLESILSGLIAKMGQVAKNPRSPHFNHYLFECLCVIIRVACKADRANVQKIEAAIFGPFQEIMNADITEFMPYVFQVLALMLGAYESQIPANTYMALFPLLLTPSLWDQSGNITGLTKLIQAYIKAGSEQIVAGGYLNALLGVFQKLMSMKSADHEGFHILNSLLAHMKPEHLDPNLPGVFKLIFSRLQSSKTPKFVKSLLVTLATLIIKQGPKKLIDTVDGIQNMLFGSLLEKVIIGDLQKVSGSLERKICSVGYTKLLCEVPDVTFTGKYSNYWSGLLQALISLHELPEDATETKGHFVEMDEIGGYSAVYSQLVFAARPAYDPTGVIDPRLFLAKSLEKLSIGYPGRLGPLVNSIDPKAAQFLAAYTSMAGVNLNA